MRNGQYSALKAAWHTDKIAQLRRGDQIVPAQIQLVISDLCNHDCHFCAYRMSGYTSNQMFGETTARGFTNNPNRKIPTEKAFEILADAAAMGVGGVQFTGGGEPTVHKDHIAIFRYAMLEGLSASLVTNGSRLADGWRDVLPRMAWLRVSLDAGTPQTYAKVRSVPEREFGKVLANVSALRDAIHADKSECLLGMSFIITRENYHEIVAAARAAYDSGAPSIRFAAMFSPVGAAYYDGILLDVMAQIDAAVEMTADDFEVIDMFGGRLDDLSNGTPKDAFCGYQQFNVYIGGDLNIYRCCNLAYNERGLIGSLKNTTLADFWNSDEKRKAYGDFDARGCVRCAFNDQNRVIAYLAKAKPTHVEFV